MNPTNTLMSFLAAIRDDGRISAVHISLYLALVQKWIENADAEVLIVSRDDLMKTAKISSRKTYYKRLNELREFGYIVYRPSFQHTGSLINLCVKE
jgi:hypothetical protein